MIAAEQETTITYDSEEKLVRIFSARPVDQGKLRRAGVTPYRSNSQGAFYIVPLSRLKWKVLPEGHVKRILPENHPFRGGKTHRKGIPE